MIKKIALLLTLCTLLLLTACSLAKPEETQTAEQTDRFVGVYIVDDDQGNRIHDLDGWIEDGTQTLSADIGNISLPRLIYPAVFVEGEHRYVFPNLKGYALFAAKVGQGQEAYTTTCSDLQNVNVKFHTYDADPSVTQTGDADAEFTAALTDYDLTGTLYISSEITPGQFYRMLNVYQKPDGTIYLDGTGDGFGFGGTLSFEEKSEKTVNGEKISMGTTKVTVTMEEARQAQTATLYWYGEKGELLTTQPLNIEETTALSWHTGAAWAVYEETFPDDVTHTLIEKGTEEEPPYLTIMTINEDGIGELKTVEIKG